MFVKVEPTLQQVQPAPNLNCSTSSSSTTSSSSNQSQIVETTPGHLQQHQINQTAAIIQQQNHQETQPIVATTTASSVVPITRKRGRRRQQALANEPNGLDRVFVWDLDGSLLRAGTVQAAATANGNPINLGLGNDPINNNNNSVLTSVPDKLQILSKKLKELTLGFCDSHLYLRDVETADQMHIDDVPGDPSTASAVVLHQSSAPNANLSTTQTNNNQQMHQFADPHQPQQHESSIESYTSYGMLDENFHQLGTLAPSSTVSSVVDYPTTTGSSVDGHFWQLDGFQNEQQQQSEFVHNGHHFEHESPTSASTNSHLIHHTHHTHHHHQPDQHQSHHQQHQHHDHLHQQQQVAGVVHHNQAHHFLHHHYPQQQMTTNHVHPQEHIHQQCQLHTLTEQSSVNLVNPTNANLSTTQTNNNQQMHQFGDSHQPHQHESSIESYTSYGMLDENFHQLSTLAPSSTVSSVVDYATTTGSSVDGHFWQLDGSQNEQQQQQSDFALNGHHFEHETTTSAPTNSHLIHHTHQQSHQHHQPHQHQLHQHQHQHHDHLHQQQQVAGVVHHNQAHHFLHHHYPQHPSQQQLTTNHVHPQEHIHQQLQDQLQQQQQHHALVEMNQDHPVQAPHQSFHHQHQTSTPPTATHLHQTHQRGSSSASTTNLEPQLEQQYNQQRQLHTLTERSPSSSSAALQQQQTTQSGQQQQQHLMMAGKIQQQSSPNSNSNSKRPDNNQSKTIAIANTSNHHQPAPTIASNLPANRSATSKLISSLPSQQQQPQPAQQPKHTYHRLSLRFTRIKATYDAQRFGLKNDDSLNDSLRDVLTQIDHYTSNWRKHATECLSLITESPNCTNIVVTRLPLVVAFGYLICLGLGHFFEVDQVYSASKCTKEACIKRIKKRFGATNRCSYIIVGDVEDAEMAKKLDLPFWLTSRADGHHQLLQLLTALREGFLM